VDMLLCGMIRRCIDNASEQELLRDSLLEVKLEVAVARGSTQHYDRAARFEARKAKLKGEKKVAKALEASAKA